MVGCATLMTILFNKTRLLLFCLAFSILVHILSFYAWRLLGTYNFTAPVNLSQAVVVDLGKPNDKVSPAVSPGKQESSDTEDDGDDVKFKNNPTPAEENSTSTQQPNHGQRQPAQKQSDSAASGPEKTDSSTRSGEASGANSLGKSRQPVVVNLNHSPLNRSGDFLTSKMEKLTYLISMLGLPVGSAELEAKNENGEIWLTLRVRSNVAISSVFPVDDIVETRHIDGRFIMTKIKQQEGSFKSDEGFTINLEKKRVSWFDNIRGNSLVTAIPTDEVLDTLSGIYYLRNRQLQIGKTETLHIYDGETYADVPVEILNRETLRLPNLQKVDTLVVRPLQKTAGIFRRTGEILIWMTDDAFKVPVKIVTSVAIGKVTIELVSAESKPLEAGVTGIK